MSLGGTLDNYIADWVIVCRRVLDESEGFVLTSQEARDLAARTEKNGRLSFWLEPKPYERPEFAAPWNRIGSGL